MTEKKDTRFKIGNQLSRCPENTGRPREYDRLQVGKDFVQWAKTHPDCLTVPHFTTQYSEGLTTARMLAWYDEDPEFREYYKEAKEQISINRLNATRITDEEAQLSGKKALDKTIYLRHVNNFDPDKRKFDREEKAYEYSLKSASEATANAEAIKNVLDKIQDNKRELK